MKIDQICKYVGLAALVVTFLLIIGGIISFYTGEFLNVRRFSNFFWFSNVFALFGIFNMVVYMALRNPDNK
jgi:uncharacterized protein involved in response to NO